MNTPVLLLIYKRPKFTKEVIRSLAKVKPRRLYVVADGPRNESEEGLCKETRKLVQNISWECDIKTNYAKSNMGLRKRVSSGVTWFFENVNMGIILEDDCVADPSFFRFCEELLEKYRDDQRIFSISGNNFQHGQRRNDYSYYFSRHNHIWGWASWRRAWNYYDDKMELWPEIKKNGWLRDMFTDPINVLYWSRIFDLTYQEKIDSWAYRWTYSCWIQNALTILPNVNLVKNIGFGEKASHTKNKNSKAKVEAQNINFPLRHPPFMIRNKQADRITDRERFLKPLVVAGLLYRRFKFW